MKTEKIQKILLVILFFVSFFPRFMFLSKGPFHYDTLDYIRCGEMTLKNFSIAQSHGPGYPLTVTVSAIAQLFGRLFGMDGTRSITVMVAILASVAVVCFFFFVLKICGNMIVSFFAALLLSFLPAFFSVTTHGRLDHGLEMIFIFLSFYVLMSKGSSSFKNIFISSVLMGLAVPSHFSAVVFIFPWALWYLFWDAPSKNLFRPKYLLATFIGLSLPTVVFYFQKFASSGFDIFIGTLKDANQAVAWVSLVNHLTFLSLRWIRDMIKIPGIAVGLLGLYFMIRQFHWRRLLLLGLWFLFSFLYFANIQSTSPRYMILPLVPFILFEAYGLYKIYSFQKILGLAVLAVLIFMMINPLIPILSFRHRHNLQKEFALYLENLMEENSVILAKDEWIFLEHYIKNKPRIITGFPSTCEPDQMDKFLDQLDKWMAEGRKIYIIETGFGYDPCELFSAGSSKRYDIKVAGEHINEDWHHKCLMLAIFKEHVFKLSPKESADPNKTQ
jgi:hypothetical protein